VPVSSQVRNFQNKVPYSLGKKRLNNASLSVQFDYEPENTFDILMASCNFLMASFDVKKTVIAFRNQRI